MLLLTLSGNSLKQMAGGRYIRWSCDVFLSIPLLLEILLQGMRRIGTSRGQLSNQSDISRSASQQEMRNTAASPSNDASDRTPRSPDRQGTVEQVHVTKCAVCIIL